MSREVLWFDSIEAEVAGDIVRFTGHSGNERFFSATTRHAAGRYANDILAALKRADRAEVLPFKNTA